MAPSNRPAIHASASVNHSFIPILLFVPHRLVFPGDPMPRIQTANGQTDDKGPRRNNYIHFIETVPLIVGAH